MSKKLTRLLPFKIQNIGEFIHRDHPTIFPELPKYEQYWLEQARRSLEGLWGYDYNEKTGEGGWRWMPGNLYFYINLTTIKQEGDFGSEVTAPPMLRDTEWFIFYGLIACDGFSGFENDDYKTCYRPVGKLQRNEELSNKDKKFLQKYDSYLRKPNGEYKDYVDAVDYLYLTHKEVLGKPLFLNESKNFLLLTSRRTGKSWSIGNGVITYDFTFNGASNLNQFLKNKVSSTVVVGAVDSKYSKELLSKFTHAYDHLRTQVGSYFINGLDYNGAFWRPYEGSAGVNGTLTNRVKIKGGGGFIGPGSKVVHVSYNDNPSAGVGYAARRMVVEEVGLVGNFPEVHAENSATQIRDTKYGYSVYIGTGGNIDKIQKLKEAFYDPESYDILSYPNEYRAKGKRIAAFIPSYYQNNLFRDANGNQDIEKAYEDEIGIREAKKKSGSKAFEGRKLSFPLEPSEMFMHKGGNSFPTIEIQERLDALTAGAFKYSKGVLIYTDKEKKSVRWYEDVKGKYEPIINFGDEDEFRKTGKSLEGAVLVFEHPIFPLPEPSVNNPQYIVFYDPVRDEGDGTSICSVIVFKTWQLYDKQKIQYNIVAEWHGRFNKLEDNHEMAIKLAQYYNAKLLPEINNSDILRYVRMENKLNIFQPQPELAISGIVKQKKSYRYGVFISPGMKPDLELYLNEVLHTHVDYNEQIVGEVYQVDPVKMVENIPSKRVLQELLYYNRDGNFDAVSCLFILGLWVREQTLKPVVDYEESLKDDSFSKIRDFSSNNKNKTGNNLTAFSY